eukprot:m.40196 g.40196  ORF g.40196 m.40196 type:complete len:204 (-) comp12731_c1_seq2:174-785(-)
MPIGQYNTTMTTIVAILGNRNEEIYHARVAAGLDAYRYCKQQGQSAKLAIKLYKKIFTRVQLEQLLTEDEREDVLVGELANTFVDHNRTGDTIAEAVGARYLCEQMAAERLIVCTSECHMARTAWICAGIIRTDRIPVTFIASPTTEAELIDDRKNQELRILRKQVNSSCHDGGLLEHYNNRPGRGFTWQPESETIALYNPTT